MAVREEMWAQAARDRDALEAELGLRHEGERERMLEEAKEHANEMVEEVSVCFGVDIISCGASPQQRCAMRPTVWHRMAGCMCTATAVCVLRV